MMLLKAGKLLQYRTVINVFMYKIQVHFCRLRLFQQSYLLRSQLTDLLSLTQAFLTNIENNETIQHVKLAISPYLDSCNSNNVLDVSP